MANIEFPQPMIDLVAELKRLPGIGPRSAERIAVWMIQSSKSNAVELSEVLNVATGSVELCDECGFFSTEDGCPVCLDTMRETDLFCVVEQPTDVIPLERSGAFKGLYHCLGGKLSPLNGVAPEHLRIAPLLSRLSDGVAKEVVLALSSDVEGEATANYLAEVLEGRGLKVSRIAQGLPAGGGLEHADELTLMRALQGRREMDSY